MSFPDTAAKSSSVVTVGRSISLFEIREKCNSASRSISATVKGLINTKDIKLAE